MKRLPKNQIYKNLDSDAIFVTLPFFPVGFETVST